MRDIDIRIWCVEQILANKEGSFDSSWMDDINRLYEFVKHSETEEEQGSLSPLHGL